MMKQTTEKEIQFTCDIKRLTKEPLIHSSITDELPENHPWAYETLYCDSCKEMLHCGINNELMRTWLETEHGNFCVGCLPVENLDECLQGSLGCCKYAKKLGCSLFSENKNIKNYPEDK